MQPCRFHLQGRCMFGKSCKYSHELASGVAETQKVPAAPSPMNDLRDGPGLTTLRADASSFVLSTMMASEDPDVYLRAEVPSFVPLLNTPTVTVEASTAVNLPSEALPNRMEGLAVTGDNEITRDYHGTIVAFRAGPAVSSIELSSDFSTIQIVDLPSDTTTSGVMHLLSSLGYPTMESAIQVTLTGDTSVATVKAQDVSSARGVIQRFQEQLGEAAEGDVAMKPLRGDEATGNHRCRIQMNTVRCFWNPSKTPSRGAVERLLKQYGKLEWAKHGTKNNVTETQAKFPTRESAIRAVEALHNTKPDCFGGKLRLYLNQIISIRYCLPTKIINAVKPNLDEIRQGLERTGYVHLQIRSRPAKAFSTLILTGQAANEVVQARSAIEKFLGGRIAKKAHNESALWDPYFLSPLALSYLAGLGHVNKVYIHRDESKAQLLLYGGSAAQQGAVAQALAAKVQSLRSPIYRLLLTPDLAQIAMQGGMLRVNERFGPSASLNILHDPKTMTLSGGSPKEFQDAIDLLLEGTGSKKISSTEKIEECPVCQDEASEPLRTSCGHTYCKECVEFQCTSVMSVPGSRTPIVCCGTGHGGDECKHAFTLDEIRSMVPSSTFESLLRSAFDAYIGANSKDLRFCPTPNCTQICRLTTTGDVITCSDCLAAICTTCNVTRHGDWTCEEYKDLDAGGSLLAQKCKEEIGAKDCPKCGTSITKDEGCDHVQCTVCNIDMCWLCMEVFEDSEVSRMLGGEACYAHLRVVHRAPYLDDYDDDDDEDDGEDL